MEPVITHSAQETQSVGTRLGQTLQGGDIVALYGNLGSGKTTFVQGLAQGLGVSSRIVSPTFLIIKTYQLEKNNHAIETFYHADFYRIDSEKDVMSLGLDEMFSDNTSVMVIEWPEKIAGVLPQHVKKIYFSYVSETDRKIVYG